MSIILVKLRRVGWVPRRVSGRNRIVCMHIMYMSTICRTKVLSTLTMIFSVTNSNCLAQH